MTMSRRRFIGICAAAGGLVALGQRERPLRWTGLALGSEASIELSGGDQHQASIAMQAALDTIRRMEKLFSIYDPHSTISRLNRDGEVEASPEFIRLMQLVDLAHARTGGLFDPTVQVLFNARKAGHKPDASQFERVGWHNVRIEGSRVALEQTSMALTFNGIAQGFATDRVSEVLAAYGYDARLINIGEYRAGATPALIGLEGGSGEIITTIPLENAAIATSSLNGYVFADGTSHALHPWEADFHHDWKAVTVVHESATMADAYSTALMVARGDILARQLKGNDCQRIFLQDAYGQIHEV